MAYLALYRRFRPTTFNEVIGQDAIVKTLTNQIKTDSVGHAYLFCGARGTGKTTLAKIFARAVNCLNPVNGSPCGECEACKTLQNPSDLNVIEMDAASNNKVENVRAIRDNVQFAPVDVKRKVYIIDEVHMLTTEAFNALLKTLEEPPKHAIFILATTEPHKLPATILSRCMRFDFKLVSTTVIANLISKIYDEIGKKYTKEAVIAIAKAGDGSVRDALSVADLLVSTGDGELTYKDVLDALGATDTAKINALLKAVFTNNVRDILSLTQELTSLGKSVGVLSKDLVSYVRDVLICKTCVNAREILSLPEEKFLEIKELSGLLSERAILRVLEILSKIEGNIRYSVQPTVVFETALLKSAMPETDLTVDGLMARISELENKLNSLEVNGVKTVVVEQKPIQVTPTITKEQPKKVEVLKDDFAGLEAPPEDFLEPSFYGVDEVTTPKKVEEVTPKKVEEQPIKTPVNEQPKAPISAQDGKRIWGSVLRRLRVTPNRTILWVACQEMKASIVGSDFIIYPSGINEEKVINKDDNLSVVTSIIKEFGDFNVKVKGSEEKIEVNDYDKVIDYFGKENVTDKD